MPIYEYRCEACGHELEAIQKMADAPLTDCPDCGRPALKKLISAAAFRLKGGGWYETDFKGGDKKRNLAADKDDGGGKPEAKTEVKSESKAESKPTAKSESKPAPKKDSGASSN